MGNNMPRPNGFVPADTLQGSRAHLVSSPNGYSAAALLDPQAMKQSMTNGKHLQESPATFLASHPSPTPPFLALPLSSPVSSLGQVEDLDCTYSTIEEGRKTHTAAGRFATPAPASSWSPSLLLNPKGYDSTKRRKEQTPDTSLPTGATTSTTSNSTTAPSQFVFALPGSDSSDHSVYENNGVGLGNLIERVHNVSKREDRPSKKQKTEHVVEDTENEPKAVFRGGSKNGEIGEYMRQKRQEGIQEAGPSSNDDDITILEMSNPEDREVCYGRLDNAKVQAHVVPFPNPKAVNFGNTNWPPIKVQLHRFPGKTMIIRVVDPSGKDFGNIDVRTSLGLVPLMDAKFANVRVQARLVSRKKKPNEFPGMLCSDYYDAHINLYGPKARGPAIGKFLSQRQVFLRPPYLVDHGVEIYNPQEMRLPALPRTSLAGTTGANSSNGYAIRTVEEIRNDVLGMFDSLQKSENLPEMEPSSNVTTPLLSHQKQGLYFMTEKERLRIPEDKEGDKTSLWRLDHRPNGQPVYVNIITGREARSRPPEIRGGILADMMGLGKTLSILSLIVGSMEDASKWAKLSPTPPVTTEGFTLKRNSKTTLLVAPLSVVSSWEEQIQAHLKPGTLSCYVYHGNSRCQDINKLATYDVVVTTYSIVSSEASGRSRKQTGSPLLQTNFFRIVLDEAHMIREQTTRQFQAVCTLSAQRRWAVTGTPVQNRLDDLGALIKFLRIKPFDEKGGFTQFILSPFKNADPEILPKLRLLVDSITLRRLKDRIDLPARYENIVRLQFSKDESQLYEWFAKDSASRMNIITGGQRKSLGGKSYVHVLQAILRLRLICAHGKELLGEEDLKLLEGFSSANAIDLDDDEDEMPVMNKRQAYEMLMLFKETDADTCVQCMRVIAPKETNVDDGKDEVIGCMLPCFQILCNECSSGVKKSIMEKATPDNRFVCPFCEQYLRMSFFELTQSGVEDAEEAKAMARENPKQAKILGRYGGPHTKTTALIEGLLESRAESLQNPDEPPIKSVVFSGWTAHLDLIQIALEDNNIEYVRLDGKMSRTQRAASLEAFRDDPDVRVILVSITAGGLGLNLTSASKVYVMEPQFNPAAEAQAVERVHRLGQKREVTISRFIMDGSFEEKMLALQKKKQNLADLSLNRKFDKAESARQKLEELRSLFK